MDKTVGGRVFAPAELRQLAPAERAAADPAVFARVEGLGRIPFANLRRPKPLMDTGSEQPAPDGEVRFGLSLDPLLKPRSCADL